MKIALLCCRGGFLSWITVLYCWLVLFVFVVAGCSNVVLFCVFCISVWTGCSIICFLDPFFCTIFVCLFVCSLEYIYIFCVAFVCVLSLLGQAALLRFFFGLVWGESCSIWVSLFLRPLLGQGVLL